MSQERESLERVHAPFLCDRRPAGRREACERLSGMTAVTLVRASGFAGHVRKDLSDGGARGMGGREDGQGGGEELNHGNLRAVVLERAEAEA